MHPPNTDQEVAIVVATERVRALFADARGLQADALEMLALGKVRNAAEKAWGATKRATDALVLARTPARSRSGHRKQARGSGSWRTKTKGSGGPVWYGDTTPVRASCMASASTTASAFP